MARKKSAKAKGEEPKANGSEEQQANGVGHNGPPELTDDQRQALTFQHKKAYENALAVKKEADAKFKNVCKLAKSELGPSAIDDIKDAIAAGTEDGEEKLRQEIERKIRIMRWMGAATGDQLTLFDTSGVPATERAYEEGRRVGMAGDPCSPPYDPSVPQYESWNNGYKAGQAVLFAIKSPDAEDAGEGNGGAPEPTETTEEATAPAE